ncbi:POU domain class 2-associating factor 1 isoform X2 [Paralichthys olivaceus]|uniref:POU domain class 2-associating factor 1 isoform X2 n=1 Tax=Paralichthys olivaceus TaxID=8255 RepID=UPI003752E890
MWWFCMMNFLGGTFSTARKQKKERECSTESLSLRDEVARNNLTSYTQVAFGSDSSSGSTADGGQQCTGGKPSFLASCAGLQPAITPWSSPEYNQQEPSAQTLAYPATTLTADLYMQTLCPSYTMLTYTHTPLLTNFGTIPVAPAPASFPQMELPDSGLTYLPWTQPLTTISTMPNPGVQFAPVSAALSGPPLVHMPLSMSVTTMIPQLEAQGADPQLQILDLAQRSDLNPEPQDQSLDEDLGIEPGSPNLLDKLLEDPKEDGEVEEKDSYSNSLFIPNV